MNLDELNKLMGEEVRKMNQRSIPEFENYSPMEMNEILYDPFGSNSPIRLLNLNDSELSGIPFLNQVEYLLNRIEQENEIKLTQKGFLPTRMVSDIYHQNFIKDHAIETGISKLYKETDSYPIHLTRIIPEIAGLTKKRNGKLSLTRKGKEALKDRNHLLQWIFIAYLQKFNWSYGDGYGDNMVGQLGYGFSLILLSKFGNKKRQINFYAEKYFRAFPQLMDRFTPSYHTAEKYAYSCYSIRTFDRFLSYFDFITSDRKSPWHHDDYQVEKTHLFDAFIRCTAPKYSS